MLRKCFYVGIFLLVLFCVYHYFFANESEFLKYMRQIAKDTDVQLGDLKCKSPWDSRTGYCEFKIEGTEAQKIITKFNMFKLSTTSAVTDIRFSNGQVVKKAEINAFFGIDQCFKLKGFHDTFEIVGGWKINPDGTKEPIVQDYVPPEVNVYSGKYHNASSYLQYFYYNQETKQGCMALEYPSG